MSDLFGGQERTAARAPVLSVSALAAAARRSLERDIGLCWVGGELSNLYRAASGHVYFVLKDANAQVRCTVWRQKAQLLGFTLKDGMAVEVRAVASLYEPKGEFQLNVDSIRLSGAGALYERFARRKAELERAGWFDPARKRALPRFPRAVGIVTSPRGAALRDVLTTLARRWPALRAVVYPTAVQGAAAAGDIERAIRNANRRREVDVLIVCRGGGSIEDLWAFNEEIVARAILESQLPVVAGIGHETDFTIADFVADVRAPTPTGAAAVVAPDADACRERAADLSRRASRCLAHAIERWAQRIDRAEHRLVHPAARLALQGDRLDALCRRAARAWRQQAALATTRVDRCRSRYLREVRSVRPDAREVASLRDALSRLGRAQVAHLDRRLGAMAQHLAHLDPRAVLRRGYSIVAASDGTIVQDAAQLAAGDVVSLTFAQGGAQAQVLASDSDEAAAGAAHREPPH